MPVRMAEVIRVATVGLVRVCRDRAHTLLVGVRTPVGADAVSRPTGSESTESEDTQMVSEFLGVYGKFIKPQDTHDTRFYPAPTRINLTTMPSEQSQSPKVTCCMFPLQKWQIL